MSRSLDGKGRTLFEMLLGRNKRDMTPQEFIFHNPLEAKIGCAVTVNHEPDLEGYNFFVESIWVWETQIGNEKFYHTDYKLKATTVGELKPIRLTLRLLPDPDASDNLGHKIQVLRPYMEFGWDFARDNSFLDVLADGDGVFKILQDRDGTPYPEDDCPMYWRVDDVRDPYKCRVTILKDKDGDGSVQKDELIHKQFFVWDYHRNTTNVQTQQEFLEVLNVEEEFEEQERCDVPVWFMIYTGREINPFQVTVI